MKVPTRSIGHATVFVAFAVALIVQAIRLSGWAWLLLWPAAAFVIVALAYVGLGVRVYGKRDDGSFHPTLWWLNVPTRSIMMTLWHAKNLATREAAYHEITPGLYLGRRPSRALPPGVTCVIDLAGELSAARVARGCAFYRSVPTLDRWVMSDDAFVELVQSVAAETGSMLVHCAQGHGRSAQLVAGVLIARGHANDVDAAIAHVKACRPGIRLAGVQRLQLERCLPRLVAHAETAPADLRRKSSSASSSS